ncbi:hypothetical protein DXG03_001221 [Asterophora parasitica]|uniref:Thioredoxin n=1 Tax=Asterophora parasitica TaxID=117018 RepID=A0A9P7G5L7_9AGAR|nr:hypothetical protein DXG03_001221 [Asterophora parasitica]
MPVVEINSPQQFHEIINGSEPAIIDFWAAWCGPCRAISPVLEGFSDQAENQGLKFYKVNVDEQRAISQEAGIRAMPTFFVYKDGQKIGDLLGANPQGLQNLIRTSLAK